MDFKCDYGSISKENKKQEAEYYYFGVYRKMGRILHVDVLSILFGLGTWLCVNGLFVQLPLLVLALPEGWNLPSYLTVVVQLANFGPLCYILLNSLAPRVVTEKRSIYFVMGIGLVTTLLLANFWEKTTIVGGTRHSTALLILVFFLASVDCSSRVLYLPFMSKFQEQYLMSYFIGEGLSGFVPSIVALIQGVGGNPECRNGTSGMEAFTPPPRFSVDIFFYALFVFTLISLIAFLLLNKGSVVKGTLKKEEDEGHSGLKLNQSTSSSEGEEQNESKSSDCSSREHYNNDGGDVSVFEIPPPQPAQQREIQNEEVMPSTNTIPFVGLSRTTFGYLLLVQVFICFWANGIFPSIQSYSSLPYGNVAYHLAVTLSNMANPVVCILAFFIPPPNARSVSLAAGCATLISGWILFLALSSPTPPLVGRAGGETILVLSWIILVALFTYVRVSIATILGHYLGKSGLFWCGAVSQAGSALGAMVAFSVVNYTKLFQSYFPCT